MIDLLHQQMLDLLTRGFTPAAIVMSPPMMKRFMREATGEMLLQGTEGSGWAFEGLPVFRCWEIGGPTIVSKDVLDKLRRGYSIVWGAEDEAPPRSQYDLLF